MKRLLLIAFLPIFVCAEPLTRLDKAKMAGWSALSVTYGLLGAACMKQAYIDYGEAFNEETLHGPKERSMSGALWFLAKNLSVEVGAGLGFSYCAVEAAKKAKAVYDARCEQSFEIEPEDADEEERSALIAKSAVSGWVALAMAQMVKFETEVLRAYRKNGNLRPEDKKKIAMTAIALPATIYVAGQAAKYSVHNARKAAAQRA